MNQSELEEQMSIWLGEGYHCSQCVLLYWADRMNMDRDFALKLGSALGLGANHGDSCGALTATAISIGLSHGFTDPSQAGADGGSEKLIRAVTDRFIEKNGSSLCRDLLLGGYDGADPDAKAADGIDPWANCAKYCADAVMLASEYLEGADTSTWELATIKEEAPSPVVIGSSCGVAGLALGAIGTAVVTYEKRRAENEEKK